MANKIVPNFTGPVASAPLEAWLGVCGDGFAVYAGTKTDKQPVLSVAMEIRMMGMALQEPTMAAWWAAKRVDYLTLTSRAEFEEKIRGRFLPKAQKTVALRDFFLCKQGALTFNDYAAALTEARNAIPSGSTVIPANIFKFHLLFHAHPLLLLRVMGIHTFEIDSANLGIDNLISLMSMQWDSIVAEGVVRAPGTAVRFVNSSSTPVVPRSGLGPLTDPERARLTKAGGCWRCRKVPGDPGWTPHIGSTCPGDSARGITPGSEYVPPPITGPSTPAPAIKKEYAGALLLPNNHGEEQPPSRLYAGAVFAYTEDPNADDYVHPLEREGPLYEDDSTDEE